MKLRGIAVVIAAAIISNFGGSVSAVGPQLFVTNNLTNGGVGGRLIEIDASTGDYVGLVANVVTPRGIQVGADGNLYVASANTNSILKFAINDGFQQSTFVPPGSGGLTFPSGMKFGPDGNLYVASFQPSLTVFRYDGTTGNFMDVFASGPQTLSTPTDLAFGPNGNLYVSTLTNGIFQFDGQTGSALGQLIPPTHFQFSDSMAFDSAGTLYVSTGPMSTVQRYNGSTGTFIDTFIPAGLGGLHDAEGIGFGPDGNLYVAGLFNDAVLGFDSTGTFVRSYSAGIDAPFFFTFVVPEPDTLPLLLIATCTTLNQSRRRRHDFASCSMA